MDDINLNINIAEYISEKFGNDILLELCRKYGGFLDKANISITGEESLEELLEIVDKKIYSKIKKQLNIEPHDNIDKEFKLKHPELYLDYNVDEEIKKKFYKKELWMSDLKNPEVRKALVGKDMSVGFGDYFSQKDEMKKLYKNLTLEAFYELIDTYGRYMENCEIEDFEPMKDNEDWSIVESLKEKIEKSIEEQVLKRQIYLHDDAPEFLKEKYPQYFIEGLSLEDRESYYAFEGKGTLKKFYETFKGDKLKAFKGKDISINFPNIRGVYGTSYVEFFENFSMDEILGDFSEYGEELDNIIKSNKIDIFKKVYEKHGKIALKVPELILQIKEEDIENINISNYLNLLNKSNFHLNNEYTNGLGKRNAERLVAKIYLFLGYDNAAELFKLPEMSKEELTRLIEEKEAEFDEACEVRFTLKGDIQIVTEMFRKLNLAKYQNGNKKIQFEIYKNINMNLENGFNGTLEELIEDSIIKADRNPNKEDIIELGKYLNSILTAQKMEKLNSYINSSIELDLTATGPNRKIITDILLTEIRKNLLKNSNINKEELLEGLNKEILEKLREDGTPFYSPQVRNHFEEVENIVENLLNNEEVIQIVSKTTIDSIKIEREKIGNGWIRKILNVPNDLSLEEIENLEQRLYGSEENSITIDYQKRVIIKNKENSVNAEEKAYKLFKELDNPLILTMSKAEFIFDRIREPYSKEFITFFIANRKEILEDPKLYTKIPQLHEIFDETIQAKEVRNRYDKGLITVTQMFEFITSNDRPYGIENEGDWELSKVSRASSLDVRKFKLAQKILTKMKEREIQTVPPIKNKTSGKYRGRILRSDDPLHLVIGDITTCCQHIGGYGETSMIHSALEKNGSLFVVEELDEFGNVIDIVAQSWTWRNNDIVCFDNIEMPDTVKPKLSNKDYEDITKVYQDTAKSIIITDAKMLKKLLDEGKITKEQYDKLVIKEVTVGRGCNDLRTLDNKGRFEKSKRGVLPFENRKSYPEYSDPEGEGKSSLYTDAAHSYIFAKISDVEDKIEQRPDLLVKTLYTEDELENIPIGYGKSREVLSHKGKQINPDDIRIMEKITQNSSSDYYRFKEDDIEDIADKLCVEINQLRLLISRDEDLYILLSENPKYIQIESLAKVVKEDEEGNVKLESKIVSLEMVSSIYDLMIEADKKDKEIVISSEQELSGINLDILEEKGLITITKDYSKNTIKVNDREKLEEESKKIKEILEKEEELLMLQGVNKTQKEQKDEEELAIDS